MQAGDQKPVYHLEWPKVNLKALDISFSELKQLLTVNLLIFRSLKPYFQGHLGNHFLAIL